MRPFVRHLALPVILLACHAVDALGADATPRPRRGSRLFFRMLGAQTNAPILPKTRSAWTQDRQTRTGSTGSSDLGFSEYPFCFGTMDFTFIEEHAVYPRLVSGAKADESIVNTADILVDHVYQPDGCVWGAAGREIVQTFTATRPELVSMTMLVASEPGTFRATLHEGGPGGRQIGPAKTFSSGHSTGWGTARWTGGQAPLEIGRTYGLRIVRCDGKAWTPYLHATGNAYDGGMLSIDGRPQPDSDLAVWIVEEPADLRRAIIDGADENGWTFATTAVTFRPRTPSVRLISLCVSPVTADDQSGGHCDLVARVTTPDGEVAAGPKRCLAVGSKGGSLTAHLLFAGDELEVTPGEPYRIEVTTMPHKQEELPPDAAFAAVKRDVRARVYGEPQPGAMPCIHNLRITYNKDSELQFNWSQPIPATTQIASWGLGVNGGKVFEVPPGKTEIAIGKFWAGHDYELQLTSTGPTGLAWTTPRYLMRMFRGTEIVPLKQPEYPPAFVTIAKPRLSAAPEYGPLRYLWQVPVDNGDFEEGLEGWKCSGEDEIYTTPSEHDVGVKWGRQMAGFSQLAGERREQVFATSSLSQNVPTTPGHVYVLSAWAHTSVVGGPRGDTRVRLLADPTGQGEFGTDCASQWYWTDGRWVRFQRRFTATSRTATIGLGLFRWRDLDRASVHVDHVTLFDLGPAPRGPSDPADDAPEVPALALVDPQNEADDKVEARLTAPPGYVITGIGSRAHYDNVTTMWLRIQPLLADGKLGPAEQLRSGWELDAGLEAEVALPPGYVATGFGAAVAPEWDVKRFRVWARPLSADGTLGEEKEFRGGVDLVSGVEREVHTEPGRVLTSAGLNCMHNDINGIRAESARLIRTATANNR